MENSSVQAFVESIENKRRRSDAETLVALFRKATGHEPKLWGDTMIGFDQYHYVYESGREGDSFLAGFSPRKQNTVVYITDGCKDHADTLARLGKHKSSVSCLYINKLDDVDMAVLEELLTTSYTGMKARDHTAPVRG